MKSKDEINLTGGNIRKNIVLFALPIAFSGFLQQLYNQADLMVCRAFGSVNSVGAIAATGAITFLIINILIGFSIGANVIISNAVGSQDKEKAERVIGTSLLLAIVCSIAFMIFGVTCSRFLLELMSTPEDIISLSESYMVIYFAGLPFTMLYNFSAALLRGMGDSKKPFYFLSISGVINVLLNLLFVIQFHMDVAGVALATIISQAFAAALTLIELYRNKGFANFKFKLLRFHKLELMEIIKVGLPAGIQGSFFSLSNVIIQSSINSFGSVADTGAGAANSVEAYLNIAQNAFGQACIAFVSANYGAGNLKNVKKSVFWSILYACGISAILGGAIVLLRYPLLSLFTSTDDAMKIGSTKIIIDCSTYVLFALTDCPSYAERGLKYSTIPMLISLVGICGLRIAYIYILFPLDYFHSLDMLFLSYPISWAVTAIGHLVSYTIISHKVFKQDNWKIAEETKVI